MNTNDYLKRVREIKNDVLNEIRDLLGTESRHAFKNPPYIHYVEGEVANTEYCMAVEVWSDGMVVFCNGDSYKTPRDKENVTEGETVYQFEPNSFFDILARLKQELREEKLQTLRELVKNAGGIISFDGDFKFNGITEIDDCENVSLLGLFADANGTITIVDEWEGDNYSNDESFIPFSELDKIIEYVRSKTEKTFTITASELLSRVFEVRAVNYEAAIEKVRQKLLNEPLCAEDSNGLQFS